MYFNANIIFKKELLLLFYGNSLVYLITATSEALLIQI